MYEVKQYEYKGDIYEIIDAQLYLKHPVSREWVRCFMYHDINKPAKRYVREAKEFLQRFKLLEKDQDQSTTGDAI